MYAIGHHIWSQSYGSPVVSIYAVEGGSLRKVPVVSVGSETLKMLTGSSTLPISMDTVRPKLADSVLQYVLVYIIIVVVMLVSILAVHVYSASLMKSQTHARLLI